MLIIKAPVLMEEGLNSTGGLQQGWGLPSTGLASQTLNWVGRGLALRARLMIYILHNLKDPQLRELWYTHYYGYCKIHIINRTKTTSTQAIPVSSRV